MDHTVKQEQWTETIGGLGVWLNPLSGRYNTQEEDKPWYEFMLVIYTKCSVGRNGLDGPTKQRGIKI